MDSWDAFTDDELYARIGLMSSSVALMMADAEDLADLTDLINGDIVTAIEPPHTLRGLVRYVLGVDIPDADARAAHASTWLAAINDAIDAEIGERQEIKAELARRIAEPDSDAPEKWAAFDTAELKLRVTREKLTTRFTPYDKTELGRISERIKRMRRRRALELGDKYRGPAVGDSLVIRALIRLATGRDMPVEQRREHVALVADRIIGVLGMAADERAEVEAELYRRVQAARG